MDNKRAGLDLGQNLNDFDQNCAGRADLTKLFVQNLICKISQQLSKRLYLLFTALKKIK